MRGLSKHIEFFSISSEAAAPRPMTLTLGSGYWWSRKASANWPTPTTVTHTIFQTPIAVGHDLTGSPTTFTSNYASVGPDGTGSINFTVNYNIPFEPKFGSNALCLGQQLVDENQDNWVGDQDEYWTTINPTVSSVNNDLAFGNNDFTIEFYASFASGFTTGTTNDEYGPFLRAKSDYVNPGSNNGEVWNFYNFTGTGSNVVTVFNAVNSTTDSYVSISFEYANPGQVTMQHMAVTRSGSTFRLFLGGQLKSTVTASPNIAATSWPNDQVRLLIGGNYGGYEINGAIDEIRISNIARYTSNFSVPVDRFDNDANTIFLTHFDALTNYDDLANITYTLTSNVSSISEGNVVSVTLTTTGVTGTRSIPYKLASTASFADVTESGTAGYFTVSGNTATKTLTAIAGDSVEGTEALLVQLSGPGRTENVSIDITEIPTWSLTANTTVTNESGTILFTVSTTNVPSQSVPWAITGANITTSDFVGLSSLTGNISLSGNVQTPNRSGSVAITMSPDMTTEGSETFTFSLTGVGRTENVSVVVSDSSIGITETTPKYISASMRNTTVIYYNGGTGNAYTSLTSVSGDLNITTGNETNANMTSTMRPNATDGVVLANGDEVVAVGGDWWPYVYVRKRFSGFNTWMTVPIPVAGTSMSAVNNLFWSPDGQYLVILFNTGTYFRIWKYDNVNSNFTALSPSAGIAGAGRGGEFYGSQLAIAHETTPFLSFYTVSGSTVTKRSNPANLPTARTFDASFNAVGTIASFACEASPFIMNYYTGDGGVTYTKLADPASIPQFARYTAQYNPSGNILYTGGAGNATVGYSSVYSVSGNTFTRQTTTSATTGIGGGGAVWSADFDPSGSTIITHQSNQANGPRLWTVNYDDTYTLVGTVGGGAANIAYTLSMGNPRAQFYGNVASPKIIANMGRYPYVALYNHTPGTTGTYTYPTRSAFTQSIDTNVDFDVYMQEMNDGLALFTSVGTSPYLDIYKLSGNTVTPSTSEPSINANAYSIDVNKIGTDYYLAVASSGAPRLKWYKSNDGTVGGSWTAQTDPTTGPTGTANEVKWAKLGGLFGGLDAVAVAHQVSPYLSVYKYSSGTLTKSSDPATLPTNTGNSVSIAYTDTYAISVLLATSVPAVQLFDYDIYSNALTWRFNVSSGDLPGGTPTTVVWIPGTQYFMIGSANGIVYTYQRTGNATYTRTSTNSVISGLGTIVDVIPYVIGGTQYVAVYGTGWPNIKMYAFAAAGVSAVNITLDRDLIGTDDNIRGMSISL